MKYKKFKVILFLFMIFPFISVSAITKEEMQKVSYTKVFEFDIPEGYVNFQGFIITDKYFVVSAYKSDTDVTVIQAYDKSTHKLVKSVSNKCYGHTNDMAYNSSTKEIYIINREKIHVLDENSLEYKKDITINGSYVGIAYDENMDKYYFRNHEKIFVYNQDMEEMNSFPISTNLTRQAISINNNKLFYTCYENGEVSKDQVIYDGILEQGANLVYVYNLDGTLENVLYIPEGYGELEAMEFDKDGTPYLIFNYEKKGVIYTPKYESVSVTLEVGNDKKSEIKEATITDLDGYTETVEELDGVFTFSPLTFLYPTTAKYTVSKTSMLRNSDEEEPIDIDIKIEYDASINALVPTINYTKKAFEKKEENIVPVSGTLQKCEVVDGIYYDPEGKETTKENFERICKTVENPQTGSYLPFIFLPVLLLSGLGFLIYKKKIFFRL